MADRDYYEKPLIEQICEQLFAEIEGHTEFDTATVKGLRRLAARGDLRKFKEVCETVKAVRENQREVN
jgi:hypothetical protein